MTEEEIAPVVPIEMQPLNEEVGQEGGTYERLARWWQQNATFPVLFLALFTVVNSLLTFGVFRNLGVELHSEGIKFSPKLLQPVGNENMENILIGSGILQGMPNISVEQPEGDIINLGIRSEWGFEPVMHISPSYINISGAYHFYVFSESQGRRFGSEWGKLEVPIAEKLHVTDVTTNKISSGKHSTLHFHSTKLTEVFANYGMLITSSSILLETNQDILLEIGDGGAIILDSVKGIFLNIERLLVNQKATKGKTQDGGKKPAYIVCWCSSNLSLFLLKLSVENNNVTCSDAVEFCS